MTDTFHFDMTDAQTGKNAVPAEDFSMNYEKIEWTYSKLDDQTDGYTEVEWTYAKGDLDQAGYTEVEWTY